MTVPLFLDVHVHRAIVVGLRLRGVDLVTAQEDGSARLSDPELLDRATALGRALVTYDSDLLGEARLRQDRGIAFAGVLYAYPHRATVHSCIEDLELVHQALEPEDLANRIEFLPLRTQRLDPPVQRRGQEGLHPGSTPATCNAIAVPPSRNASTSR